MTNKILMTPSHYYRSKDRSIWNCISYSPIREPYAQIECVRMNDNIHEFFSLNGQHKTRAEYFIIEEVNSYGSKIN